MKHNQTLRRGLGILVALVMCLSLLPVTALAEVTETADFVTNPKAAEALLNAAKTDGAADSTWDSDSKTLTLNGVNFTTSAHYAVKLPAGSTIVLNGTNTITAGNSSYKGNIRYGIYAEGDLNIKGDGMLTVTGDESINSSYGIYAGSYYDGDCGNITISGGTVNATGGTAKYGSCGIYAVENVNISGGSVTANGGKAEGDSSGSCGIYAGEKITISGGTVTANGGEANYSNGIYADNVVTISGETVYATGGTANGDSYGIVATNVDIKGGTVNATGGTADDESAGIYATNVDIKGGTVTANGYEADNSYADNSYGIYADENVNIYGGTVTATGGTAYSWSDGIYADYEVNISGGRVYATGGEAEYCSTGIEADENVNISGGTVTATGSEAGEYSDGIYAYEGDVIISGGTVTATGGEVTGYYIEELSYAVYSDEENNDEEDGEPTESFGIESYYGNITISGGHVIAKTEATNEDATRSAMNVAPDLSDYASYKWRTDDDGSYTSSATKAYTYNEDHTYVEIDSDGSDNRGSGSRYSLEQITSDSKYAVNVNVSGDGTAKSDKKTAAHGSTVTITVAPNEGCEFIRMVVTDKYGDVIDFVDQGNGEYTFRMPDCNVYVDAYFTTAAVEEPAEKTMILTIGETAAEVNGEYVENDVAPVIRNERTMLPVRFVAEALGAEVAWDEAAQKVTITKGETVIEIYINQPYAFVNNEAIELDSPAFIENSRTYLPLRFIVENLGAEVAWDAETQKVTIKY